MTLRHLILLITAVVLVNVGVLGQRTSGPAYSPGLNLDSLDRTIDPCEDFYHYACGGWQKQNPIPPDQVSWDITTKMYEENLGFLRRLLEEAARKKLRDTVTREVGDFYAACMNESATDRRGISTIQPELKAIRAITNQKDLAPLVAHLQLEFPGNPIVFGAGSRTDFDNADLKIAGISQGGLGLPDRDYYIRDDPHSNEIRDKYLRHVQKVFELMGAPRDLARADSETVMRMETALARASLTSVERRDPYKSKNKMTVAELSTLAPNFQWPAYFGALGVPELEIVNVGAPVFFKQFDKLLVTESLDNWKVYLRFHVADSFEMADT